MTNQICEDLARAMGWEQYKMLPENEWYWACDKGVIIPAQDPAMTPEFANVVMSELRARGMEHFLVWDARKYRGAIYSDEGEWINKIADDWPEAIITAVHAAVIGGETND